MKLSLSVRVAEDYHSKRKASMGLETLARLAVGSGYSAICMRASQMGVQTPRHEIAEGRRLLDDKGLAVSMVTGDFPIPENSSEGPAALRNITPYLDLADDLGSDMLRICMKTDQDIPWAQKAADEANERRIRLVHQCHHLSLFEQVQRSLEVVRQVDRNNFGMVYEPANLELCGQDYGDATIKKLAPHIFNVYLQNQRLGPEGTDIIETWARGGVRVDQIPIWGSKGIDYSMVASGLKNVGYDGYITVHQSSTPPIKPPEAILRGADFLKDIFGL